MDKIVNMESIKESIKVLFIEALDGAEINEAESFIEAGGDSMKTMEIISELEAQYETQLDVREVMADPSINSIAAIIDAQVSGKVKKDRSYRTERKLNLYDECVLDESITLQVPYEKEQGECTNYFLTGATGFLGAFLIKSILNKSPRINLYCHVRGKNKMLALNRIKTNMMKYECWKEAYYERIIPVNGDLRKPMLGIDPAEYDELSEKIDIIIHNGAMLNFIYSYDYLRRTNVVSTVEAIKFAFNKKSKYLAFISSYSVFDNPSHFSKNVLEDDPLESAEGYFLGYSETKWVCEKILAIARKRGLKTLVFRPGDITGSKKTGIWEARDLTSRVIIGCIQMKVLPIINMKFNFTPVDYVADVITHITAKSGTEGRAYNIINPDIKSSAELLKACIECKIPVLPIPYKVWQDKLHDTKLGANALKILESMFTSDDGFGDIVERHAGLQATYSLKNTKQALWGSGIHCPSMDKELLKAYLRYFKKQNMI